MKTTLAFLTILFFGMLPLIAQDVIVKLDGTEINGKVTSIESLMVVYELKDSSQARTLSLPKSDVFMIRYANGLKEVFYKKEKSAEVPMTTEDGCQVLIVHPVIGEIIDLSEKKYYKIFPDYYFSNRDFKSAQFLKKPNGTIVIRATLNNGKVLDKISSQKEMDYNFRKIDNYSSNKQKDNRRGAGIATVALGGAALVVILVVAFFTFILSILG